MGRLGRIVVGRPRAVLTAWLVLTAVLVGLGIGVNDRLTQPELVSDGSESARALGLSQQRFGFETSVPVLLKASGKSTLDRSVAGLTVALEADPDRSVTELRPEPGVALVLVTVRSDGTDDRPDADADAADEVREIVAAAVPDGVEYHLTGTADILGHLKEESLDDAERGELIALPILIVVLLMVFRTPVGALIPAVFGGLSVLAGMGLLFVATEFTDLTVFAATLASMMGLALGVDYSLLLISRYREETARGATPQQAALAASQSAGRTVAHAGAALAVAMIAAMLLTDGDLLNPPAIGVLAATVVSVLGALVALPALLVLVGPRVDRRTPGLTNRPGLGAKLARKALQRPGFAFIAALVPLLALAAPTLELETGPAASGSSRRAARPATTSPLSSTPWDPGGRHPSRWSPPTAPPSTGSVSSSSPTPTSPRSWVRNPDPTARQGYSWCPPSTRSAAISTACATGSAHTRASSSAGSPRSRPSSTRTPAPSCRSSLSVSRW